MTFPSPRLRLFRLVLALLVVAIGGTWTAHQAAAQVTATVSPSLLELNAKPGASGKQDISVAIESDADVDVTAEIVPYDATVDVRSAVDWLSLDETDQVASSGDEAVFALGIEVPDDVDNGGWFAAVTLTTGPVNADADQAAGQAAIQGQFIVPVLITIGDGDDLVRTADLTRIAPVLEADGRIGIWGEIHNTGNVALRAPGEVSIKDSDDKDVAKLEFPETTPILPGETQIIRATGTLPLPNGGAFTAAAAIDIGADDMLEASADFTVAPGRPEGDLTVCENLDRGPTIGVQLSNAGDLGLATTISVGINDADGNQVTSATLPDSLLIWPGSEQGVSTDAPNRLETGAYTLVAQVQAGAGEPITIEQPFEIGGTGPDTAPLCPPPASPEG